MIRELEVRSPWQAGGTSRTAVVVVVVQVVSGGLLGSSGHRHPHGVSRWGLSCLTGT